MLCLSDAAVCKCNFFYRSTERHIWSELGERSRELRLLICRLNYSCRLRGHADWTFVDFPFSLQLNEGSLYRRRKYISKHFSSKELLIWSVSDTGKAPFYCCISSFLRFPRLSLFTSIWLKRKQLVKSFCHTVSVSVCVFFPP